MSGNQTNDRRWHLVQVSAKRKDQQAAESLLRQSFEVYYPQLRIFRPARLQELSKRQRAAGVTKIVPQLEPLFPRYLFTRFNPFTAWRDVFRLSGVCGMVIRNNLPVEIPDEVISNFRRHEIEEDGILAIPGSLPAIEVFKIGESVILTDGPFLNHRATIERIRTESLDGFDAATKFTILVEMFGRWTRTEVDARSVKRASA